MSRRKSHLAPVPTEGTRAPFRSVTERIELPTGGRRDVDGLLRELARIAFPAGLTGFSFELDRHVGARCSATVMTHEGFTPGQVDAGRLAINRALLALGILKPAKPAETTAETTACPSPTASSSTPAQSSQPT